MKTEPSETMEKHRLRVLIVDDSLMMRTLISDILASDPEIVAIETARNSKEALSKVSSFNPDCITLDLVIPGEDGLSILKKIMEVKPTPVVILSALSRRDASITFECLAAGAVSFVAKPSGELSLDIETIKSEILENVKAAARISHKKIEVIAHANRKHIKRPRKTADRIIVIGASTGGPQTLEEILTQLSDTLPCPILVVQHMPNVFFTESFAERLARLCRFKMGSDGVLGMKAIKKVHGMTIAQDENAIIFGMPRAAIEAGVVDRILSPAEIVEEVLKLGKEVRKCVS